MYQEANQWMYGHAEAPVVGSIKRGGNVFVETYSVYGYKNSTVPTALEYFTSGSAQGQCVIQNNPSVASSYCR
ncbi:hypothetical protein ABZ678_17110 [Streptomyces hirsutus]|uniref:hypothetical protein n=1 Tax=Streptomyces hirsutus TaxID=35620 RepID=UPI00340E81B9